MGDSQRLTVRQVRQALELVYECCELGADPVAWRQHLLAGLNRLVGGAVSFGGQADWGEMSRRVVSLDEILHVMGDVGFPTSSEREAYLHWLRTGTPHDNPMTVSHIDSGRSKSVATREQVVTRRVWQRAPVIARLREQARLDEAMSSFEELSPGVVFLLAVQRPRGERGFGERERKVLELVHDEIRGKLGTRLATFGEPGVLELPPRLQEVLHSFLQGLGEKQVAAELNLSPHTVHEHAKRLNKHFGVTSRGELLIRCYRYLPILQQTRRLGPV
jgi:DNA-binding CsgD family transcriptional regulator